MSADDDGDTNGSLDIFQSYQCFHAPRSLQPPPSWLSFVFTSVKEEEVRGVQM